ncbi:hypothetical protein [Senegalia sp. (in: firmicutes)]|uniref:hypothetical protein n=1 Tax=Senegalia sp. (in: firmicutes) TaxID=1924098 RepID=UPI003F9D7315
MEQTYNNYYEDFLKGFCRINDIYLDLKFEKIEGMIAINIKNTLKNGVSLDCLRVIDFIYRTVIPFNIQYTQTLHLYPGGKELEKVTILFTEDDYKLINKNLESPIRS